MLTRLFLLALIALPISPALCDSTPLDGSRPNIILVMTDDQGYGPVGAHGHPWIRTPQLDLIHAQSTRFQEFLVSPTCAPTRSALMTGRHPMRNGITHTILERERMTLEATTIAEVLRDAGYATGIFGKWHLGDEEPYQPHKRGFTEAFVHGAGGIGQKYPGSCADAPGNKYFDPAIRHNGSFVKTKGFCTDIFFRQALSWIRARKQTDKPFFAYITTNAPHGPFIAPPKNRERFTKLGFGEKQAGFYGMIENIDENVGLLLEKLAAWGLEENTLLIFLSDNGMTGGGSGKPGKPVGTTPDGKVYPFYNADMKGLKGSVDQGGVRVPAFFMWKGKLAKDREVTQVARHIDMFPTLAALAGAKLPADQVEGRSLLPLLAKTPVTDWPDRMFFFHKGRWPKGAEPNDFQWKSFSVRNQRFLMVGKDALFDMQADPGQQKNVAEAHPQIMKKMIAAYDAWWKKTRPMMVNEKTPNAKNHPYHDLYKKQVENGGIPDWKTPDLD